MSEGFNVEKGGKTRGVTEEFPPRKRIGTNEKVELVRNSEIRAKAFNLEKSLKHWLKISFGLLTFIISKRINPNIKKINPKRVIRGETSNKTECRNEIVFELLTSSIGRIRERKTNQ